jgi:hypothetical protein
MIRNNLRGLEQKVNASDKLSDADKFDLQQYITRCYGSLTTFNILFKNKDDQFRTSAQGGAVDRPTGWGTARDALFMHEQEYASRCDPCCPSVPAIGYPPGTFSTWCAAQSFTIECMAPRGGLRHCFAE